MAIKSFGKNTCGDMCIYTLDINSSRSFFANFWYLVFTTYDWSKLLGGKVHFSNVDSSFKWIILKVLIVAKSESIGITEGEKSYDWHVNDNYLSNLKSLVRDSCLSLKLYTVKQKIYI